MSRFKRHQSKVFWSQMESRDLHGDHQAPAPRPGDAPEDNELEMSTQDESDQEVNTTVIHVEPSRSATSSTDVAGQELDDSPDGPAEARSFSPATSRGQRSQDSGFSDSGRSDSSGTSGLRSPERRRRRRRSSRGSRSQRLAGRPAPVAAALDPPAHTSTPKQHRDELQTRDSLDLAAARQLLFHSDSRINEDEEHLSSLNANESEENLEDFLYASEPPEDDSSAHQRGVSPEASSCRDCSLAASSQRGEPAVRLWLDELRADVEDECMATLQSKCLPKRRIRDKDEAEARDQRLLTATATTAAKKLIDAADRFDERYQQVVRSIGTADESELLRSFEAEATGIWLRLGSTMPRRRVPGRQEEPRSAAGRLARLKLGVDAALEERLDAHIEKVVAALDGASREDGCTARGALAALTALGLAGPKAGASVARCSGIRTLLTSLVSASRSTTELRCSILRALASVCCCLESVDQLVRDGGPEILVDAINSEAAPQAEKSEAAALLVQITSPWMDYVGIPYVEPFGPELVRGLTELAERSTCKQTLLLAAAALNHLARSRRCIASIVDCDSIKRLLRCVKKSNGGNVCLMEQVASLVGQVARVAQARAHLAETRASVALVCFLRMQPPGLEDEYRRLAATTSEALTRLCVDPEIAKQVVAVGGSNFLPEQDEDEREQQFYTTKSLRVARKIAAEQIDIARIWDHSPN